jgi:ABC-type polysaccharide/polyol phosphate transport system ATPase subunit
VNSRERAQAAFPSAILIVAEWFLASGAAFMENSKKRIEEMVRHSDTLARATFQ